MLRQLRQGQQSLVPALGAVSEGYEMQQIRGMKIFEIFSKEKRAEHRANLKEEMQRGYFDDFRDFRDSKGKVFHAPQRLIPAAAAPLFPPIHPLAADGSPQSFPPTAPAASLVCVAFRAGAQDMIEAWAKPFSQQFQHNSQVALYELALIESQVMALWPFRNMLMANGTSSQGKYALPATYLYYFKDSEALRTALHMTNRLTGYVYLLDSEGRVRWRGSGNPDPKELDTLLKCSEQLLQDNLSVHGHE